MKKIHLRDARAKYVPCGLWTHQRSAVCHASNMTCFSNMCLAILAALKSLGTDVGDGAGRRAPK